MHAATTLQSMKFKEILDFQKSSLHGMCIENVHSKEISNKPRIARNSGGLLSTAGRTRVAGNSKAGNQVGSLHHSA